MTDKLDLFIKEGWGKVRTTAKESDFDLPFPFVPPSISTDGLFRTLYYWDTYFTNAGLIEDGYLVWARYKVLNGEI